jgi:hypothetical protein
LEIRVLDGESDPEDLVGNQISIQNSSISGELPGKFPDISGIPVFGFDQENANWRR